MACLVACLGEGKGSWQQVAKLTSAGDWEQIFIVMYLSDKDKFKSSRQNISLIAVDEAKSTSDLAAEIAAAFDGKIFGDAGINFLSGDGKLHMAVLSALLKIGAGVRLVSAERGTVEEI